MSYFAGKVAVVTGAGSGIGRALAQALNAAGCVLEISDINADSLEETRSLLSRSDTACESRQLDVADRGGIEQWARDIEARYSRVDIVINNAGVALTGTAEDNSYEDIEWLMNINFWGVVYGCKSFLPLLHKSPAAHLVNISSLFGIIAVPTQSAYHAAKFAVRGYTESLRQELAESTVHVCCVHPGGIKTNIARSGRTEAGAEEEAEMHARFDELAKTTPESAAAQILGAMEKRKPRLLIGRDAKWVTLISRIFPTSYPRLLKWLVPGDLLEAPERS
jgi:NADP-dependent 3-hydroxy acid dehydrogenase YdfG